ncbi:MAG: HD domain-containing phosphohydrolase [Bacillota bacterium]
MNKDSPGAQIRRPDRAPCDCQNIIDRMPGETDFMVLHRRLIKTSRAFRMLACCTQAMLSAGDEISLLERLCCIIVRSGYSLAWVGYAEFDEEKSIRLVAMAGEGEDYARSVKVSWGDNPYGQGPTGFAIRTGESHVARYLNTEPGYSPWREAAERYGYASSIAIPLYCEGAVLGALNVYSKEPDAFDPEEVSLLEDLANDISFGIASIRLRLETQFAEEELRLSWAKLARTLQGTVRAMAAVTEIRDPYTAGHQQRVSELAGAIAVELGLTADEAEGIRIAGLLHDVGKVYVPIQILAKPGSLSPAEFNLVKAHSEAGYEILRNVDFPWPIAETVLQHHERIDGSGYPHSVDGAGILVGAKIIAVADTVEAMSNFRPYRPAFGIEAALNEVLHRSRHLYDPCCAKACADLFQSGRFSWPKTT